MKKLLITLVLICYYSISISQNKTCNTPKESDLLELNTIAISKCNSKTDNRRVSNQPNKDSNAHYVRKKKTTSTKKNKLKSHILLFSSVDKIPLFPKCTSNQNKECFKNRIYKHFEKNFHPENASDDGIQGRVFVQITINSKGKIEDIYTKGPKNAIKLEQEVKRVIAKLPIFTPASHKGYPVSVKYSFPLNFHTD